MHTHAHTHQHVHTPTLQSSRSRARARAGERERERERLTGEDAAYPSPQKHASDRPGGARGPGGEAYALWSGGQVHAFEVHSNLENYAKELSILRSSAARQQCRPLRIQAASLLARMQAASLHACIRLVRVAVVQVSSRHSSVVVWWLGGCSLCGG